jgi:hypothetical protein
MPPSTLDIRHSQFERARVRCLPFLLLILLLLLLFPSLAPAAVFTTNLTLTETNFAYDGQDIVIDGAMVAIDGLHAFNSYAKTSLALALASHRPLAILMP